MEQPENQPDPSNIFKVEKRSAILLYQENEPDRYMIVNSGFTGKFILLTEDPIEEAKVLGVFGKEKIDDLFKPTFINWSLLDVRT